MNICSWGWLDKREYWMMRCSSQCPRMSEQVLERQEKWKSKVRFLFVLFIINFGGVYFWDTAGIRDVYGEFERWVWQRYVMRNFQRISKELCYLKKEYSFMPYYPFIVFFMASFPYFTVCIVFFSFQKNYTFIHFFHQCLGWASLYCAAFPYHFYNFVLCRRYFPWYISNDRSYNHKVLLIWLPKHAEHRQQQ